jgi:hypothetical protein
MKINKVISINELGFILFGIVDRWDYKNIAKKNVREEIIKGQI